MLESKPLTQASKKDVADLYKHKPSIWFVLYHVTFIRSLVKWLMRKWTGTCELQRILKETNKDADRAYKIEQCLTYSRNETLKSAICDSEANIEEAVCAVMKEKGIIPEIDSNFKTDLSSCLHQIHGYKWLFHAVENLRSEKYSFDNKRHEALLRELWDYLMPDAALNDRISKQWCDIGFQGDDPSTDFRGMGLLGLMCLHDFAKHHTDEARRALQHSHHPKYGYSYAIVGINMTALAYEMLQSGQLRTHFYNKVHRSASPHDFYFVFSAIFRQFDEFWMESEPENVMEFNRIRNLYRQKLSLHLNSVLFHSLTV